MQLPAQQVKERLKARRREEGGQKTKPKEIAICAIGVCRSRAGGALQCSSVHNCVVDLQDGALDACLDLQTVRAVTHTGEEQTALGFTRQQCHG